MYKYIKKIINQKPKLREFIINPINFIAKWIYGAYLTFRYVDEYQFFPAIIFKDIITLRIYKGKNSKLIIQDKLIISSWIGGNSSSTIAIGENGRLVINGAFYIGNDVRISLSPSAKLILHGKDKSSGSGITSKSVIMVKNRVEIGKDTIIAWDTFITDCDWHLINGNLQVSPTIIGDWGWMQIT